MTYLKYQPCEEKPENPLNFLNERLSRYDPYKKIDFCNVHILMLVRPHMVTRPQSTGSLVT